MDPRNLVPYVIEISERGERAMDIYSLLLRERIVFIGSQIDDNLANLVVAQILYLAREDPEREIRLYIHSPGGGIYAGLAIYDTMQSVQCPVETIAIGSTASMGTVLLASGTRGHRYALPNATIHIHQPLGGVQGQATEIKIQAEEILRIRTLLNEILAKHTGQMVERIAQDTERDFFMTAETAKEYGLVDQVLQPSQPSPEPKQ